MRRRWVVAVVCVALVTLVACTDGDDSADRDDPATSLIGTDQGVTDLGPGSTEDTTGTTRETTGGTRTTDGGTRTTGGTGTDSTDPPITPPPPKVVTRMDARPVLLRTQPVGVGAALGGPRAHVTTAANEPVAGAEVVFKATPDGPVLCTETTGDDGFAKCAGLEVTKGMLPGLQYVRGVRR